MLWVLNQSEKLNTASPSPHPPCTFENTAQNNVPKIYMPAFLLKFLEVTPEQMLLLILSESFSPRKETEPHVNIVGVQLQ